MIYFLRLFSFKNNLDNSKSLLLFSLYVILTNLFIMSLNFILFFLRNALVSLKGYETQILVGDASFSLLKLSVNCGSSNILPHSLLGNTV